MTNWPAAAEFPPVRRNLDVIADVCQVLADPLLRQVVAERFWAKVRRAGPDECWL